MLGEQELLFISGTCAPIERAFVQQDAEDVLHAAAHANENPTRHQDRLLLLRGPARVQGFERRQGGEVEGLGGRVFRNAASWRGEALGSVATVWWHLTTHLVFPSFSLSLSVTTSVL